MINRKGLLASASGFTLIELLIVIVIIGILAGVLIAVIDPTAQQNRARDANVRAAMNKIALTTSGYISAYGRIADEVEFDGGLTTFSDDGLFDCATPQTAACTFSLTNVSLPLTCGGAGAGDSWGGDAAAQCHFYYCGGTDLDPTDATWVNCAWVASPATTTYRIYAKAFGSSNTFLYSSHDSVMYLCDGEGVRCTAAGT